MSTKNGKIKVAAIGDIHVFQSPPSPYRELFAEISEAADILLLCGDLTNVGSPEEARNLAEDIKTLKIPVLGVLGNHDHQHGKAAEVAKILAEAKMVWLEERTFVFKGVGFAGAKGFVGGFDDHMLVSFGEQTIKNFVAEAVNESLKLENDLRTLDNNKIVVVLHYSPITQTIKGEPPEIYPFLGCSRLAETIDRFRTCAVFHGHAHRGHFEGRTKKGVPVYNCSLDLLKRRHPHHPFALVEI